MPRALNIPAAAPSADRICVGLVDFGVNRPSEGEVTIEVRAAGVNPSDVKAMLGFMPNAVFPRTPGRDFAGVVVEGPRGPDGRSRCGAPVVTSASRATAPMRSGSCYRAPRSRASPRSLSMLEAGTVGVPFVTAYEGLRRAGYPGAASTVAVFGASGKVGQAVVQLAARAGAAVFAINRRGDAPRGFACKRRALHRREPRETLGAFRAETGGMAR